MIHEIFLNCGGHPAWIRYQRDWENIQFISGLPVVNSRARNHLVNFTSDLATPLEIIENLESLNMAFGLMKSRRDSNNMPINVFSTARSFKEASINCHQDASRSVTL